MSHHNGTPRRTKQTARKSTGSNRPGGGENRASLSPGPSNLRAAASERFNRPLMQPFSVADETEDALARARLPTPLPMPRGPPLIVQGAMGALTVCWQPGTDPRPWQIGTGFPISVHPLRIPNTRALFSSGSTHSVIDFKFVRMAGLLHKVIPLRQNYDDVQLGSMLGGRNIEIYGRVEVLFDAMGFEFNMQCWVINAGPPVEMILGRDFAVKHELVTSFRSPSGGSGPWFKEADARKVRDIQDVYITQ